MKDLTINTVTTLTMSRIDGTMIAVANHLDAGEKVRDEIQIIGIPMHVWLATKAGRVFCDGKQVAFMTYEGELINGVADLPDPTVPMEMSLSLGQIIPVDSFADASAKFCADRDSRVDDVDAGAGRIFQRGIQTAHVSFNGRVWVGIDDGTTIQQEITW